MWLSAGLGGLLLCAFVVSATCPATIWWYGYNRARLVVCIDGGSAGVFWNMPRGGAQAVAKDCEEECHKLVHAGRWHPRFTPFFDGGGAAGFPLWMPAVLLLGCGAVVAVRSRRIVPGHCPCGYNLTGNVSGRCPECGRTVANSGAAVVSGLAES